MCRTLNPHRVLITCGGNFQGTSLIDLIRSIPAPTLITLVDYNSENINKYNVDFFYEAPPIANKEQYVSFIYKIIETDKITHIIPATSLDLNILSSLKEEIYKKFKAYTIVPDIDILEILLSKKKTTNLFKNLNLPVLEDIDPKSINESNFKPLILKPNIGFGGKGIIIIQSYSEFQSIIKNINVEDYVINKYIENFDEYSIDFSINFQGKASLFIPRKRILVSSGFAVVTEIDMHILNAMEDSLNVIKKTFSKSQCSGIYNIQIIKSKASNKLYFTDINPRVGTSSCTSIHSGYNIANNLFNISSHQNVTKNTLVIRNLISSPILPNKIKIKNAIFDLDNTLVDTYNFTLNRFQILYEKLKLADVSKIDFLLFVSECIYNDCLDTILDAIAEKYKLQKNVLIETYQNTLPDINIFHDALSLLYFLKHKHIKLFLLTRFTNKNTHQHKIKKLEHLFTRTYLVRSKIEPKNEFINLIEKEKINPQETISIGDDFFQDILPSIKANIKLVFYLKRNYSFKPHINTDLMEYHNLIEIHSLHQIKNYIV